MNSHPNSSVLRLQGKKQKFIKNLSQYLHLCPCYHGYFKGFWVMEEANKDDT